MMNERVSRGTAVTQRGDEGSASCSVCGFPMGLMEGKVSRQVCQLCLRRERRDNWIALQELHPANRFRLMFAQPLLDERIGR